VGSILSGEGSYHRSATSRVERVGQGLENSLYEKQELTKKCPAGEEVTGRAEEKDQVANSRETREKEKKKLGAVVGGWGGGFLWGGGGKKERCQKGDI